MSELSRDLSDLAGSWVTQTTFVQVAVGLPATQLVPQNALRWGLILAVPDGSIAAVQVAPVVPVAYLGSYAGSLAGLTLTPGQTLELQYRAWGGLVQHEWLAVGRAGGTSIVVVIEVIAQQ